MYRLNLSLFMIAASITPASALAGDEHGHEHGGDAVVGVDAAGKITLEFDTDEVFPLPPVSGLISGYALDDPGFLSLEADEVDLFMLDSAAAIALEIVSIDPALNVWAPGLISIADDPGEQFLIGTPAFDEHPTWHIDTDDPAFDPLQQEFSVTFRLIDQGSSAHAPSDNVTMRFAAVPEPAALTLMATGALVALRRRNLRGKIDAS